MSQTLLIANAKLISKTYEKLYWSIDEKNAKILKKVGCTVKTVVNEKYGTSFNISTKVLNDILCNLYKSVNKGDLEEMCLYDILIQVKPYDYMGKKGKSMVSFIKLKVGDRETSVNQEILKLMSDTPVEEETEFRPKGEEEEDVVELED